MSKTTRALWVCAALQISISAQAAKVNLPSEGNYAFDFCMIGHGRTLSGGDQVFEISYDLDANLRSNPPGGAFDRMGARCYGIYTRIQGRQREMGVCEITDLDGDKWWMDYQGNPDGAGGKYVSAHGTGKYEGMTLSGEYRIDNNWGNGNPGDVAFRGCNPNKGHYKLK